MAMPYVQEKRSKIASSQDRRQGKEYYVCRICLCLHECLCFRIPTLLRAEHKTCYVWSDTV